MEPLDDFTIDTGPAGPRDPERPVGGDAGLAKKIVAAVVAVVGIGVVLFVVFRRPAQEPARPAAQPKPAAEALAQSRAPLGPPVDAIALPSLELTDPLVRDLLGRLSSRPEVMAWLATDGLVRNFVVCVDNVATGDTPTKHLRRLAPRARFRAENRDGTLLIDPRAYARYDGLANTVAALDPAALARIYSTLKPRLVEAYQELGHPDGDIDGAVEAAIARLLQTPLPEGDVALRQKSVAYLFSADELENLSPAQKQLLRMGPRNERIVQDQLRAIARELGIPPQRLVIPGG